MTPKLGNRRGFTLVEVFIAIFIFAVSLTGVVAVAVSVINANALSKEITTATTLGIDKMEMLKNTQYSTLRGGGPETLQTLYTRTWTVTDNSPATDMKTVQVRVSWNRFGRTHNVTLNSIIGK